MDYGHCQVAGPMLMNPPVRQWKKKFGRSLGFAWRRLSCWRCTTVTNKGIRRIPTICISCFFIVRLRLARRHPVWKRKRWNSSTRIICLIYARRALHQSKSVVCLLITAIPNGRQILTKGLSEKANISLGEQYSLSCVWTAQFG